MKRKAMAVALGLILGLTSFAAVGCKKKIDNSSSTIEVFVYQGGYGVEWLDAMEKAFEEKTDYNMEVKIQKTGDVINSMILTGPSMTTDLFIVGGVSMSWDSYVDLGGKAVAGYDCCLAPLDRPDWKEFYYVQTDNSATDHYYALPWASLK